LETPQERYSRRMKRKRTNSLKTPMRDSFKLITPKSAEKQEYDRALTFGEIGRRMAYGT